MSQARRPPKRFAPLDPEKGGGSELPQLKGVVFDVDGTLWWVSILFGMFLLFRFSFLTLGYYQDCLDAFLVEGLEFSTRARVCRI